MRLMAWLGRLAVIAGFWLVPLPALAQSNIPVFSMQPPEPDPAIAINESNVGILDPAVPFNMMRLRYDLGTHNRRPTRATYFQPMGGLPGTPGPPLPETNVDYQELSTYAEFAFAPWFSSFAEVPYRWIDPDVNANRSGFGDANFGIKMVTWTDEAFIATILFRVYNPAARHVALGTHHWSLEPGLLTSWRVYDRFLLEGELRYWVPLGGGDHAGDILRYGLGLSYGQRSGDGFWFIPVLEGVGWSVLGGKELVVTSPSSYELQNAEGQTIVNGYLGLRLGLGYQLDGYLGYGRCFTGNTWHRDMFRAELRLFY